LGVVYAARKQESGMPVKTHTQRILALDLARTLALVCMAIFHFTLDLEMFGYLPSGTTQIGFWYYFPRMIAGSFLFLAGISLYLAHGPRIRWPAFLKRFAIIAGAALVVTVATYYYNRQGMVLFGILHCIAASSLIGLVFLRLPALLTIGVAAVVFALPWYVQHPMFNATGLLWLGLSAEKPWMMDYVPIFPWLAPFLAGLALAKLVRHWPMVAPSRLVRTLAFPGQHSLIVYLIHQPILIGLIWAYTVLAR
jgi:uncharacterized membrane protein